MVFYDKFVELCATVGKAPSAVALEIGCSKPMVTNWKQRGSTPTDTNLKKIADYFGVTVDYLLGNEEKKAPEPKTEREVIISEIMAVVESLSFEDLKSFHRLIVK